MAGFFLPFVVGDLLKNFRLLLAKLPCILPLLYFKIIYDTLRKGWNTNAETEEKLNIGHRVKIGVATGYMALLKHKFLKYIFIGYWCLACNNRTQKSAALNPQEFSTAPVTMKEEKPRPPVPATAPDPGNRPDQVAPGSCRVVGKVIAIKPELEPDKTTPCGKVPCQAVIKIMKVEAYGAAFKPLLAEGREVPVYFAFTLSPSAAYFPGLATSLLGLKIGSEFYADLRNPAEGSADKPTFYLVYTYTLK